MGNMFSEACAYFPPSLQSQGPWLVLITLTWIIGLNCPLDGRLLERKNPILFMFLFP